MSLEVQNLVLGRSLYVKLANAREPIETVQVDKSRIWFLRNIFPDNQLGLKTLVLTRCGIRKIRNGTFRKLRQLQNLDLSRNSIQSLDESLFVANHELENIFLASNRVKEVVAALFEHNPKLKVLDLDSNLIRLFNNRHFGQLEYLNLRNNFLLEFKNNRFPSLITLVAELNQLGVGSFEGSVLPELIVLRLKHNEFVDLDDALLRNLAKVEDLSLNRNGLTAVWSSWFANSPRLVSLNLANNDLDEIQDGAFANLAGLKKVTLSGNGLRSIEAKMFALDPSGKSGIEKLRIQSNRSVLRITASSFETLQHIKNLTLRAANICCIEKGTFSVLKKLEVLDVSDNHLRDLPSECLPIGTEIRHFDVSRNKIEALDDDFFGKGTILVSLDLSHNLNLAISENAFAALADSLEMLCLKNVWFANHLIPNLGRLKNLRLLEFDSNRIGAFPNFCFLELTALRSLVFVRNSGSETLLENPIVSDRNLLVYLSLQDCRIRTISSDVFRNLLLLERLNLSENCLRFLEENLFASLEKIREINLNLNPLQNFKCNHFKFNNRLRRLRLVSESMRLLEDKHLNLTSLRVLTLAITCKYSHATDACPQLKIVRL